MMDEYMSGSCKAKGGGVTSDDYDAKGIIQLMHKKRGREGRSKDAGE